jgi:hypothetical protein
MTACDDVGRGFGMLSQMGMGTTGQVEVSEGPWGSPLQPRGVRLTVAC